MNMHIDHAREHHLALGVDNPIRLGLAAIHNTNDFPAIDHYGRLGYAAWEHGQPVLNHNIYYQSKSTGLY
jgi:hypothetical protein